MANSTQTDRNAATTQKDTLFDLTGLKTGVPVTKRVVITLVVAVAAVVLCSFLPLDAYGPTTGLALGWLLFALITMIFLPTAMAVPAMAIVVGGCFLQLWDWSTVQQTLATSPYFNLIGMMTVGLGVEFTPLGRRLALMILKAFGQKLTTLILVITLFTTVISSCVANNAANIMMSGIVYGLLMTIDETPGKSKFGRVLMMLIPAASMLGGAGLINGAPTGNTLALTLLSQLGNGATITYGQWALMAYPCVLITVPVMSFFYIKCVGFKASEYQMLSTEYYAGLLKELGPINGSEIRCIVTILGMIICMSTGLMTIPIASITFALVSIAPVIGTARPKDVFQKLPFVNIFALTLIPILSKLFSEHGLGDVCTDLFSPIIGDMSPLVFSIACSILMAVCVNCFINSTVAGTTVGMGIIVPICLSLGYNPALVLFPAMLISSFFFIFGMHWQMGLNMNYGYWQIKDAILPATLTVLFTCIVFPPICFALGTLAGIPIYL